MISELVNICPTLESLRPFNSNGWLLMLVKACEERKSESLHELLRIVKDTRSKEELKGANKIKLKQKNELVRRADNILNTKEERRAVFSRNKSGVFSRDRSVTADSPEPHFFSYTPADENMLYRKLESRKCSDEQPYANI